MNSNLTKHRKNIAVLALLIAIVMVSLSGRLAYLMIFRSGHYSAMAEDLHQRERTIKAARGRIIDANGVVIADNRTVCTISVIYNQVTDREHVIQAVSYTHLFGVKWESIASGVPRTDMPWCRM